MARVERVAGFNQNRTFGTEFEVLILDRSERDDIAEYPRTTHGLWDFLVRNGVHVHQPTGYHNTSNGWTGWKMERDGSIRPRNRNEVVGIEIISPILRGDEGLAEVKRVLALMKDFGTTVNVTCGMHVHHGVSDLTESQLVNLYELYRRSQVAISGMLPNSRRQNEYCYPLKHPFEEISRVRTNLHGRRRNDTDILQTWVSGHGPALNFGAYTLRGTVEFRQHSGTVDYEKFEAWVVLTQAMVESVTRYSYLYGTNDISLKRLLTMISFYTYNSKDYYTEPSAQYKNVRKYILKREKKFAPMSA